MESSRDHNVMVASPTQTQTPAGEMEEGNQQPLSTVYSTNRSTSALLSPTKPIHRLKHLQRLTLRCKASTKRKVIASCRLYDSASFNHEHNWLWKSSPGSQYFCVQVEEMEVDDFFDGIKRLYNEETTTVTVQEGPTPTRGATATGGEGGSASVCTVLFSRQEGSVSPCPPLQPVSTS